MTSLAKRAVAAIALMLISTLGLVACGEPDPQADPRLQQAPEDSGRILFAKDGDIYVWDGSSQQLTEFGNASSPEWAPDGNRFLFIRSGDAYSDLTLGNLESGSFERLTDHQPDAVPGTPEYLNNVAWALDPTWSPDGVGISYSSDRGTDLNFLWYQADPRSNPSRLHCSTAYNDNAERPDFSPSGTHVVFAQRVSLSSELHRTTALRICELDTGELVELLPDEEYGFFPRWSPDGEWIAFVRHDDGGSDLWAVPADGGDTVQLTHEGNVTAPEWSPNGDHIAFFQQDGSGFKASYIEFSVDADGTPGASDPSPLFNESGIDAPSGMSWIE